MGMMDRFGRIQFQRLEFREIRDRLCRSGRENEFEQSERLQIDEGSQIEGGGLIISGQPESLIAVEVERREGGRVRNTGDERGELRVHFVFYFDDEFQRFEESTSLDNLSTEARRTVQQPQMLDGKIVRQC